MENHLLSVPEVCRLVAMHKTTVYKLVRQGKFPPPVKTTGKASRWRSSEVERWINGLGRSA